MTGHKNRLSNHRFITFYHVPCPHVLFKPVPAGSRQTWEDLLDGEVYKCSLVGQLSNQGIATVQTLWLRCDANSLESNLFFLCFFQKCDVQCRYQAVLSQRTIIQGGPLSNILCAPCRRLRHWMAHGPLEVLLSDPWLKGSGTNASNISNEVMA